jgi:hypothetical protein
MLEPLKQFICDTCHQVINSPEDGWIEWISKFSEDKERIESHSFRIVHHHSTSPQATPYNEGCYQHSRKIGRSDSHLHHFLDENYKMANILTFLDIGPYHDPDYKTTEITDMRQYVETVRRITIPHYEEARLYWEHAKEDGYFNGANQLWIYGVENLKILIEEYGDKDEECF